jgi:hypothetical protein
LDFRKKFFGDKNSQVIKNFFFRFSKMVFFVGPEQT